MRALFNLWILPSSSSSSRLCVFACALMERQLHVGRPHEGNVVAEYWSERLLHHPHITSLRNRGLFIHSRLKEKIPHLISDEYSVGQLTAGVMGHTERPLLAERRYKSVTVDLKLALSGIWFLNCYWKILADSSYMREEKCKLNAVVGLLCGVLSVSDDVRWWWRNPRLHRLDYIEVTLLQQKSGNDRAPRSSWGRPCGQMWTTPKCSSNTAVLCTQILSQ